MRRWIVVAVCCVFLFLPGVGHSYMYSRPLQLNIYNATDKPIVCQPRGRQAVIMKLLYHNIDVFPPTTIMPHEFGVFQFYSAIEYGLFERLLTCVPLVVDGHKVSVPLYSLDWPRIDNYTFRYVGPQSQISSRDYRFITVAPNRKIYYRSFDYRHPYRYPVPPTDWKQLEKCQPPQYPLTY